MEDYRHESHFNNCSVNSGVEKCDEKLLSHLESDELNNSVIEDFENKISDTIDEFKETYSESQPLASFGNATMVQTENILDEKEECKGISTKDDQDDMFSDESEKVKLSMDAKTDHCAGHSVENSSLQILTAIACSTDLNTADSAANNVDCEYIEVVFNAISTVEDENCDNAQAISAALDEGKGEGSTAFQELSACKEESTLSGDKHMQCSDGKTAESSLIADMKELKNDLTNLTADVVFDSFGLQSLFAEHRKKTEKSKSAKKRKKQQQKLVKPVPAKPSSSCKFAQCTEELVFAREADIDGSLTCPVCLELYHLPRSCHPCGHIYCDPCLRRLTTQGWEGVPCPLCRTVIQTCELQQEFDHILRGTHPDIYSARYALERHSRFRHYKLPFTPPVPLGRRLIRHLRTSARNRRPDSSWMSHDWFKFLLGCTVGVCTSMLIMLLNRVKSINDVRDVNIMFLSLILGASLTVVVFKMFKI